MDRLGVTVRRGMGAARVVVALLLTILAGCGTSRAPARIASAVVDYVEGVVLIDGAEVHAGATIKPTFQITTGDASTAMIVFDQKNILRIEERTEAYIDLTADVKTVELRRGGTAAVLRKLGQAVSRDEDRFRVKTPSAVAGVRGTSFYARVEDPTHGYICACNGTVHVSDAGGGNARTLTATHHEAWRFALEPDGAVTTSAAEMAYHTDEGMEALAARIGESIDWSRLDVH